MLAEVITSFLLLFYFCSCLLQNNLLGGAMLFEIEKPRLLYFRQHFDTEEVILQQTREQVFISILPRQQNRTDRFPKEGRSRSIGDVISEKAVPSCTLLILGMQTIGFLFEKEYVL